MTQEQAKIHAPELSGGYWVNSEPLTMATLRGRPVLVDFWDYTCLNCIRTLPYVTEWHRRYSPHGLAVIGVHAPEFAFAKELDGVKDAIRRFGIEYPVVMDNGYSIWQAYANRYWPAKYLTDHQGYIRYFHFGEGAYEEIERAIQTLVTAAKPDADLPDPMPPVRDEDSPGAVCYRVTPELYLGFQRGRIGNPTGFVPRQSSRYEDPGVHAEGFVYLQGEWTADEEYVMKPWAGGNGAGGESSVTIKYTAKDVNLVMNALLGRDCRAYLSQDGAPLPREDAGEDVELSDDGRAFVEVASPRMYRLVANRDIGSHDLTLTTDTPGLALYAFTFTSCLVP
jgi:thiol-disulfide isomerase/thioredoxin